jgi:Rap1a immunity proteins
MKPNSLILAFCGGFLLCLGAVVAYAQEERLIELPMFFVKAQDYPELSEATRKAYTTGLMDGFYASAFFGADGKQAAKLAACTKRMDSTQITAIITKYVKEHPDAWHDPLSMLGYNAMNSACPGGLHE